MTEGYKGHKHRTGDKQVDAFIIDLEKFAVKHNVLITNIKGWTKKSLIWMAENDCKCCCSPDTRVCPCMDGVIEALRTNPDMECRCSILKHPDNKKESLA